VDKAAVERLRAAADKVDDASSMRIDLMGYATDASQSSGGGDQKLASCTSFSVDHRGEGEGDDRVDVIVWKDPAGDKTRGCIGGGDGHEVVVDGQTVYSQTDQLVGHDYGYDRGRIGPDLVGFVQDEYGQRTASFGDLLDKASSVRRTEGNDHGAAT